MLVHLDVTQELIRDRLHRATERAEWARLVTEAEAAAPPEPTVHDTAGPAARLLATA